MLFVVALGLPVAVWASSSKILGVHPNLQAKYTPISSNRPPTWKCLDGTQEILFSAVNDDYCDCSDGSDEPGTSACINSTFYCTNEGHIGATIPVSRVRDGLCEPECCDGTDEAPGICPNNCKAVGEEHAKREAAANKIRKTGSKIRSTYLSHAQKEKTRLEKALVTLQADIVAKEQEVERLRVIKDHSETLSLAEMELKRQSPLYKSLLNHMEALKSYRREFTKLKKRDEALGEILVTLREGYNPNYQDMAVLEAVRGWEALEGLPPKDSDEEVTTGEAKSSSDDSTDEVVDEGSWTEGQLQYQLDGLITQDYLELLLSHETYLENMEGTSTLMDLAQYLPDSLLPHYISFRNSILSILRSVGILKGGSEKAKHASDALKAFEDAENAVSQLKTDKENTEQELGELFDPERLGSAGEWKKLENLCLEKDTGDYTYEVCFFGSATQKAKRGANQNLGEFDSWNTDAEVGSPAYYSKQYYRHGTQCWNGPERSVTLELTCGTENILRSVTEPEKCEYHITGETPALCLPLELDSAAKSDL